MLFYFAIKTLERSYLLKLNGKVAERPQHMLMRVAIGIHEEDLDAAIEVSSGSYLSACWYVFCGCFVWLQHLNSVFSTTTLISERVYSFATDLQPSL